MENVPVETVTASTGLIKGGWKGILFNTCFILYYYLTYHLVASETHETDSYGLGAPILFSTTLALIIFISLIAEPFAIMYKIGYENYNVKGRAFHLPGLFLFVMVASRFFVRVIFFMAAVESLGIHLKNGGVGAGIIATFVFVGELVLVFSITDKSFVGRIKPTLRKELFTRFILLNMLVLFTFFFKTTFLPVLTEDNPGVTYKILMGLLLFLAIYLPNTIVQVYGDWRASTTIIQKCLYILSLAVAFFSIILF
ncbi:MAG: hypothetical protein ABI685_00695 [Ferruginibacter sp.]